MALKDYIIRRIIVLIPVFFLISIIVFTLIHLAPGDPVDAMMAEVGGYVTEKQKDVIRNQLGLNEPVHIQYFIWISKFVKGDLGRTIITQEPVATAVSYHLMNTLKLTLISELITIILAVSIGVISATRQYSIIDNLSTLFAMFGWSMPNFWVGLLLIFFFTLNLGWLPSSGMRTVGVELTQIESIVDSIKHLIMPVSVLAFGYVAYLFRLVRSSMLEVLRQDYITTARAKGLKERIVLYKHALRNALLPVVTSIGMDFSFIIGGSAITETIFSWPGLGRYFVWVAMHRDFNAIMGVTMTFAIVILIVNFFTDITYAIFDPRIKY